MDYPNTSQETFLAWQPNTWPVAPAVYDDGFAITLKRIFQESMIDEIANVINSVPVSDTDSVPTVVHKGHVIALAILCGIDTLSSYAYKFQTQNHCITCGHKYPERIASQYKKYIETFFPVDYRPFANEIYKLYRCPITHSWNLFGATMSLGNRTIQMGTNGIILGLNNFFVAFETSMNNFIEVMRADRDIQRVALHRYEELRTTATPLSARI